MNKFLIRFCLMGAVIALVSCAGENFDTEVGENEASFTYQETVFKKGLRTIGGRYRTEAPALMNADYTYICTNSLHGKTASELAMAAHERIMARPHITKTRLYSSNLGMNYQETGVLRAMQPVLEGSGCRFINLLVNRRARNTDKGDIFRWLLQNGITLRDLANI